MNIFAASILIEFMARRVHRRAAKKSVHVGTMGPKAAGQSELSWKLKLKVSVRNGVKSRIIPFIFRQRLLSCRDVKPSGVLSRMDH